MKILSIDVGIINFAFIYADVSENFELNNIIDVNLVDITKYNYCSCEYIHNKTVSCYMKHLFKEFSIFKDCDIILVERQPIMGITSVEQIIMYEYQHKTILVSPNAMHSYFNINKLTYEKRKEFTVNFSNSLINKFEKYNKLERKCDIADAVCLLLYYLNCKKNELLLKNVDNSKFSKSLEQFIYTE